MYVHVPVTEGSSVLVVGTQSCSEMLDVSPCLQLILIG